MAVDRTLNIIIIIIWYYGTYKFFDKNRKTYGLQM